MKKEWVTKIRDRCVKFGVPFFFKQWGGVNKKRSGRRLDGRYWDEMPHPVRMQSDGKEETKSLERALQIG